MNTPRRHRQNKGRHVGRPNRSGASPASSRSKPDQLGTPKSTPRNTRAIAAQVVQEVYNGAFASTALDYALKNSGLDVRDRSLLTELVYGTLRWAAALEVAIKRGSDKPSKKLDKKMRPHLLVAAYQLQHLDDRIPSHAVVGEAVANIKKVRPGLQGFANALLRNLGPALHVLLRKNTSSQHVALAYGFSEELASLFHGFIDDSEWQEALAAMNERPALALRLLDEDCDEEKFLADLEKKGKFAEPHTFVPRAFLVAGAGAVPLLPGFSEGRFLVQDPASQLVSLLAKVKPGEHVLDLCAAPGTKTISLARDTGVRGSVLAVDVDEKRACRIQENVERALPSRCGKIDVLVKDARELAHDSELANSFDVILLDAPCSALGTVRRHPEVKLRRTKEDIEKSCLLQAELLDAAVPLLKPGGTLVYAVCSPLPQEGREQITAFLDRFPAFQIEAANEALSYVPQDAVNDKGCLQLYPHRHQCDAFFAARLIFGVPKPV
ncbi:MAG: 16S rRNA (cytosine(967)-C(5))-methyltransferase RsmB [Deltaproteobacteria bacterium]|nr:16S rRNA (cytosine(967)-C(5))-methyltransferase RsmB [Deltaproteobacteria bacterium]